MSTAPAVFQRIIDHTLQGILQVLARVDDILVTGESDEEHLYNLEAVLERLRKAGLTAKRATCRFFDPSVVYMGHQVDKEDTHPTDGKLEAIKNVPVPENRTQIRSSLGLLSYYMKFIGNLATILEP